MYRRPSPSRKAYVPEPILARVKVTLNGQEREVQADTVAALVEALGLAGQAVAVEVNREVVPKRQHADTPLRAGDAIEVVTLVGGG